MYIKLKNGKIDRYPYLINDLKIDNPQVSFPSEISLEVLKEFEVFEIIETDKPSIDTYQILIEDTPKLINDVWTQVWLVKNKSDEEIIAHKKNLRLLDYREESDPLFFKSQRGEITQQEWLDKVAEIKARWA